MIGTCMQAVARSIVANGQTAAPEVKNNFSSIYVRQTHDDTRARIEDTLNRLRKEKGQPISTPLLVSNGKTFPFSFPSLFPFHFFLFSLSRINND